MCCLVPLYVVSACLPHSCLSVCLSVCPYNCLSVRLSVHPSVHLSVCLFDDDCQLSLLLSCIYFTLYMTACTESIRVLLCHLHSLCADKKGLSQSMHVCVTHASDLPASLSCGSTAAPLLVAIVVHNHCIPLAPYSICCGNVP